MKCLLQHLFSIVPAGRDLNYLCQRYLTRTLPLSEAGFLSRLASTNQFYQCYLRHSPTPPGDSTCLDFSAGTHLQNPIGLSLLGFRHVHTADVARIARAGLISQVLDRYAAHPAARDGLRVLPQQVRITRGSLAAVLEDRLRVSYLAPVPISRLPLPLDSIDFVVSRTTLEHVPANELPLITRHCFQLLRHGGIAVFSIDYRDHWSFFDSTISVYNFLRYPAHQWERWNPPIHYQNRLRHGDYAKIFCDAGFTILENEPLQPTDPERAAFDALPVDEAFTRRYTRDELLVTRGLFVLCK